MKIFPYAPSKLRYYLIVLGLIAATLYTDYITGQATNVIIFFLCTTVYPIIIIAIASRVEGENIDEMLGLRGDIIYMASMILISGGMIGLIFFFIIEPMASAYVGTDMYKAITVMYMPLSSQQYWFATVTPLYSLIFYSAVSTGEELLKVFGWKTLSNWLYEKFGVGKWPIIILGLLISFLGWLTLHFISWGGLPLEGIIMGVILSVLFMVPYFFSESVLSPETGIQISSFSVYAPIGGHLFYDFYLSLMADGFLTITLTTILQAGSVLMLILGGVLLVFKYYQTGFFDKGFSLSEVLR